MLRIIVGDCMVGLVLHTATWVHLFVVRVRVCMRVCVRVCMLCACCVLVCMRVHMLHRQTGGLKPFPGVTSDGETTPAADCSAALVQNSPPPVTPD